MGGHLQTYAPPPKPLTAAERIALLRKEGAEKDRTISDLKRRLAELEATDDDDR